MGQLAILFFSIGMLILLIGNSLHQSPLGLFVSSGKSLIASSIVLAAFWIGREFVRLLRNDHPDP